MAVAGTFRLRQNLSAPMRHRPTDCRLQAAGEGVKQLDNELVVWRTSNMEIQQPKDSRYVKNAGAVFNLSYHIVFCPKYRRKVLVGDVETEAHLICHGTAVWRAHRDFWKCCQTTFICSLHQTRLDAWQRLSTV